MNSILSLSISSMQKDLILINTFSKHQDKINSILSWSALLLSIRTRWILSCPYPVLVCKGILSWCNTFTMHQDKMNSILSWLTFLLSIRTRWILHILSWSTLLLSIRTRWILSSPYPFLVCNGILSWSTLLQSIRTRWILSCPDQHFY